MRRIPTFEEYLAANKQVEYWDNVLIFLGELPAICEGFVDRTLFPLESASVRGGKVYRNQEGTCEVSVDPSTPEGYRLSWQSVDLPTLLTFTTTTDAVDKRLSRAEIKKARKEILTYHYRFVVGMIERSYAPALCTIHFPDFSGEYGTVQFPDKKIIALHYPFPR